MKTANYQKSAKSLLILDLNGVLGHYTRQFRKAQSAGIYSDQVKPIHQDNKVAVFQRPQLDQITFNLLIRQKKYYDIALWSSMDMQDTQIMTEAIFGRFLTQLLFVKYTARPGQDDPQNAENDSFVKPIPLARNFSSIWAKFPQYNIENTLMISNHYNEIEDFQRNDLVIPEYQPNGQTDFLDDKHLSWTHNYIHFLASMEHQYGQDMRLAMTQMSYDLYLKRVNKKMRYDSYNYQQNIEF